MLRNEHLIYLFLKRMADNEKSMKHQTEELTKDQKLDKVFWFKVIISIIFGIIFGIFKFTGFITLIG